MVQDSSAVHGLALTLRTSTESETFDLGGLPASTIESVIKDAFSSPFPNLREMIRLTLVVGAGKQNRQKYDGQALKVVTVSLQASGFSEDRGASCIVECAGMYKLQHDTGKNLKTVVVFPKLLLELNTADGGPEISDDNADDAPSLLILGSLEAKVANSTLNVFTNMVQSKCPTWSQKKSLLQLLDDSIIARIDDCDQLLMTGQLLSAQQQTFYDACRDVTDKRQHVQTQLQAHVDKGDLTKAELDHLQHQNEQRLQELKSQGKSTTKAQERHEKLQQIAPKEPAKLQHHAALGKLWKQLAPVQHLDEHSNRLLSVHDTQLLGKKMELLEQIDELEQASRGWLEEEDIFDARLQASRKLFHSQFGIGSNSKKKCSKGSGGGGGGGSTISAKTKVRVPVSKWVVPAETKQSAQAKKKARLKKGDVFGAMMATDSDSDEDGDDEDESEEEEYGASTIEPVHATNTLTGPSKNDTADHSTKNTGKSTSNKNKKKNKKKRGGADKSTEWSGIELAPNQQSSKGKAAKQEGDTSSSIVSTLQTIFMDYLVPFILAIITWLVGILFGKPKPKNKKGKQE